MKRAIKLILLLFIVVSCSIRTEQSEYRECQYKYKVGEEICILGIRMKIVGVGLRPCQARYLLVYVTPLGMQTRWVDESALDHCK